jgi:hypothetical protein
VRLDDIVSSTFYKAISYLTIAMAMMLHCYTQHFEGMHPDSSILDSLLALQNHVYRSGEETDECVSFRSGEEYLREF